ncbi:MAG: hypothetical protein ACI8XO_004444 [Verrucomicrobiales bacterium]|jgi:hypothetical protein
MRTFIAFLSCLAILSPLIATAKPGDEIDRLVKAYYAERPAPDATVQALLKIMEESPEDAGIPKAFAFIINHGGVSEGSDYELTEAFLARLEKHHGDNDALADGLLPMIGFREDEVIAFFARLGDASKSDVVSAAALHALASSFEHDSQAIDRYDEILQKQIDKHPDLRIGGRDLAGYAKQKLFASKHLRIGKIAPEIEGEDAAGKQFKLSDYRGKVVFFNFWGDW